MKNKTGNLKSNSEETANVILSLNRRRAVTAGIMLGSFLAALETTVVGTAMPTVIASLGGLNVYSWVFSAYLLTSTVTVPIWGRLSDLLGRRSLYTTAVIIFLVGSALSGASTNIWQLIIFRAVQGFGAGGIVPLGMTINGDIYTLRERARIQGLFSIMWGLASILGPLAGGFITEHWSWHWVFYINIPFGIAAALVVGLALKEPAITKKPVIDYAGASYLFISITLLLVVLVETSDVRVWKNPLMMVAVLGTFLFGYLFIRTEQKASEPILPLSIFHNRIVAYGSLTGFLVGTAMFGALSFIPLFVQGTLGGSATEAGVILTPLLLGWVILAIIGGRLMLRIGYRPTIIMGLVFVLAAFIILSRITQFTPRWVLLADIGLMGSGMGLVMLTLVLATQNSVGREQLGIATSLTQFSRSIGGAVGVAVMGTVLTMGLAAQQTEIQRASGLPEADVAAIVHNPSALIEPAQRAQLPTTLLHSMESALAHALHNVFIVGAVFAALAVLAGFRLPASATKVVGEESPERSLHPTKAQSSAAECEKLLMTEMATIDAEHEPEMLDSEVATSSD
jgi:EmrB/QacA subfamily drug resistance transporter